MPSANSRALICGCAAWAAALSGLACSRDRSDTTGAGAGSPHVVDAGREPAGAPGGENGAVDVAATSGANGGSGSGGVETAGAPGLAGAGGVAGANGVDAALAPDAGAATDATMGVPAATACCDDGLCICRGEAPTALTAEYGPYASQTHVIEGVGCVYYPTDAAPPFAAVAFSESFIGVDTCYQGAIAPNWPVFFASHGIVLMLVYQASDELPEERAAALATGIAALKVEHQDSRSPLFQKLAGRYGVAGASMGGGAATIAAQQDPSLSTNVAIMPWGPASGGVAVPSLLVCGNRDQIAPCDEHGGPFFDSLDDSVPKLKVTVPTGHTSSAPGNAGGSLGEVVLAFEKVFLERDQRWRPLLLGIAADSTNIR